MPAELDQTTPAIGAEPTDTSAPEMGGEVVGLHDGEQDREGAMAKADLYKLANYSHKLFQQIQDEDQLEGWVQAKITKAADYIASVYHYLEYEMKFSEYGHHLDNSDTLSEGQKMRLKEMLSEAKDKMKDLKKSQAEKMKEKKMDEGMVGGGHKPCVECGGTGMVYEDPKPVPAHVQNKVDKYKTLVKATKAAHKRIDANHNGVPDDEESVDEEMSSTGGTIDRSKPGVVKHKHNPDRFTDEPHAEPPSKVKARSAADKAGEKAQDKADEKESKAWGKANPGKQTFVKAGKKVDPNAPKEKKEKDVDETYGVGVYEAKKGKKAGKDYDGDGKVESDKDEVWGSRAKAAAKAGKPFKEGVGAASDAIARQLDALMKQYQEAKARGDQKAMTQLAADYQRTKSMSSTTPVQEAEKTMSRAAKGMMKYGKDGMKALAKAGKDGKDLDKVRDKFDKYDESAKPSAGLSAAKKSATVKKAKAGGDIGKPGKGFDKLAKKAGGGEKGEKIAAAAMWKNMKETTAYMMEKAKATKDLPGKQEKLDVDKDGKLEKSDFAALRAGKKETVKESTEISRLRELTGRLNQNEKTALNESSEVASIRALTKRLLG